MLRAKRRAGLPALRDFMAGGTELWQLIPTSASQIGAVVSTQVLNVDSFAYWMHTRDFVDSIDIFAGVFKSYFFGAAIALISCHRGFNSRAGAEGVGRAATEAFVFSFIAILFLDFVLGLGWNNVYRQIWPQSEGLL